MTARIAEHEIVFVAVPDFYVEAERRENPRLRGCCVLVGGDPAKRGRVQSASPEARAAGVRVGSHMRDALALCPEAVHRPTNMSLYREVSGALVGLLRRIFERIETAGLGEAYAEVSGRFVGSKEWFDEQLGQLQREVDLPLESGVAPSRLLARLAAEEAGRGGVKRLRAADVGAFLHPLPVTRLPRVGDKTAKSLQELGVSTIGEMLSLKSQDIEEALGNHGLAILAAARGRDLSPLRATRHPKSISRGETLAVATRDQAECEACLRRLSASLDASLSRQGLRAGRVAIRVRLADETKLSRSLTLDQTIASQQELDRAAQTLLARCGALDGPPVRALGLVLAGLVSSTGEGDRQLELFEG